MELHHSCIWPAGLFRTSRGSCYLVLAEARISRAQVVKLCL